PLRSLRLACAIGTVAGYHRRMETRCPQCHAMIGLASNVEPHPDLRPTPWVLPRMLAAMAGGEAYRCKRCGLYLCRGALRTGVWSALRVD
ncbi:MAG TPA: hypothetical protein VMS38_25495, partial [Pseudorhodoferax sp.]|nr:hypothetical protein [Pseudorhodoferax sp.]